MSYHTGSHPQLTLARRTFLQVLASATGAALLAACKPITAPSQPVNTTITQEEERMTLQKIVANGVELHYVEQGQGEPIVLVHGGLSDYREWGPQMARFAQTHRVIAYSQRYYYPNQNLPIVADYTTLVDAADLAALLHALKLERSHVIGNSSGAFIALAMALEHPALVRTLTLTEPPILHWASGLPGGDAVLADFMGAFWEPVGAAFRQGDKELALRTSIKFFIGADVLDELPAAVRQVLEENLAGWEAFTTSADCFPMLDQAQVAQLPMPSLLLTAEKTLPIHQLVNRELVRLLPQAKHVTIPDATHEMWTEQPEACGAAVLAFLQAQT
ncbi:MAG: alpha/beta hydrolase [Caldilinea sp. CFX5]|nr:alpha/beta hydrolase [Caldilinea sp. CFX5]